MLRKTLVSSFNNAKMMTKPLLVAFDFDHTIIDDNSDIVVRKLLPHDKISDIKHLYRSDGWTAYMQKIFHLLHSDGFTKEDIGKAVTNVPPTQHLDTVLKHLKQNDCDVIIISDANSVFIQDWLNKSSLDHTVDEIFTNAAKYNDDGCLEIEMYHFQDWCTLSTKNLCKGFILDSFISKKKECGVTYSKIAYVGDGKNDYCPVLRLRENDLAFPREGYALVDILKKNKDLEESPVKASVHPWRTGTDILDILNKFI